MRPSIILPVEVMTRELDAKLLLASIAAQRGWRVFVGCRWRLLGQFQRLPPSIYIGKDVSPRTKRIYDILPALGHAAVGWDEEALVYMSRSIYRHLRISPASLSAPRGLFAWGEDNADLWRTSEGYAGQPIFTAGNPRADLLRPGIRRYHQDAADEIRARFGDFVLLNSNFGVVNHYKPAVTEERLALIDKGPTPEALVGTWQDGAMIAYRRRMLEAFLAMLPRLASAIPDTRIVVRPHPSESPDVWRDAAADCPNVSVVGEGAIVPWLLASSAVLHNGCTTAVEGYLLGRPVVAYQPIPPHSEYDIPLPNALSRRTETVAELVAAISAVLAGSVSVPDEQKQTLARFVASAEGPLACDRIIDGLEQMAERSDLFERRPAKERLAARAKCEIRAITRRLGISGSHRSGHTRYLQHIFPAIDRTEILSRIDRLADASGRFQRPDVFERGSNLFELRAA